jgi:hypothetical protein
MQRDVLAKHEQDDHMRVRHRRSARMMEKTIPLCSRDMEE